MNPSQVRAIVQIIQEVEKAQSPCHNRPQWKRIEIDTDKSTHGQIYLVTEFGSENDEHTMASVFCRDFRIFSIGKKGAITLLNGEKTGRRKDNYRYGLWEAVHSLAK